MKLISRYKLQVCVMCNTSDVKYAAWLVASMPRDTLKPVMWRHAMQWISPTCTWSARNASFRDRRCHRKSSSLGRIWLIDDIDELPKRTSTLNNLRTSYPEYQENLTGVHGTDACIADDVFRSFTADCTSVWRNERENPPIIQITHSLLKARQRQPLPAVVVRLSWTRRRSW